MSLLTLKPMDQSRRLGFALTGRRDEVERF